MSDNNVVNPAEDISIDGLEIDFDSPIIQHIQEHGALPPDYNLEDEEEDSDEVLDSSDNDSNIDDETDDTSTSEEDEEEQDDDQESDYESDDEESEDTQEYEDDEDHESDEQDDESESEDEDTEDEEDNEHDADDQDTATVNSAATELYDLLLGSPIKANGTEHRITSKEEALKFIQKGMNYELKMNRLKPVMRQAQALKDNSVSDAELNMLIAIRNGNKTAINHLLKAHNIDPFTLEEADDTQAQSIPTAVPSAAQYEHQQRLTEAYQYAVDNGVVDIINQTIGATWSEEAINMLNSNPAEYYTIVDLIKSGDFHAIYNKSIEIRHRAPAEWTDAGCYAYVRDEYMKQKNAQQPVSPDASTATSVKTQPKQGTPKVKTTKRTTEIKRRRVDLAGTKGASSGASSKKKAVALPDNLDEIDWEGFSQLSEKEQKEIERLLDL